MAANHDMHNSLAAYEKQTQISTLIGTVLLGCDDHANFTHNDEVLSFFDGDDDTDGLDKEVMHCLKRLT